jgi:hypothetical protein
VAGDKDCLGVFACERRACAVEGISLDLGNFSSVDLRRCACLEQKWCTLRRWIDDMPRLEIEILSFVLDGSDLVRIEISIVFGIGDDGIITPRAFPESITTVS